MHRYRARRPATRLPNFFYTTSYYSYLWYSVTFLGLNAITHQCRPVVVVHLCLTVPRFPLFYLITRQRDSVVCPFFLFLSFRRTGIIYVHESNYLFNVSLRIYLFCPETCLLVSGLICVLLFVSTTFGIALTTRLNLDLPAVLLWLNS